MATGTLYHHLRFLKGLIEQNSNKKYCLTEEGVKALDIIFQEHQKSLEIPSKTPSDNSRMIDSNNILEPIETISPELKKESSVPSVENQSQVILENQQQSNVQVHHTQQLQTLNFFNVNNDINYIPEWFFKLNLIIAIVFPFILFLLQPKVIFFHFIPIKIHNSFYVFATVIFPIFNIIILFIISTIKQEKISLQTIGLLSIYYNLTFILTLLTNFFTFSSNDLLIRFLSLLIQALFIIFWTLSISLQYYSWERSLFLAILQNYILFFFF